MPVVPPVFTDIFCEVYGSKMKKLFERDEEKWKEVKKDLETTLKIKQDPLIMVCLSAMMRVEFEAKIKNDTDNPLIKVLKEKG